MRMFRILSMLYIKKLSIFKKYKIGDTVLFHIVGDEDEGQISDIQYRCYKGDKWNKFRVMYLIFDTWYLESLEKIRPRDDYTKYIIKKL